jgi:hypothetical protein
VSRAYTEAPTPGCPSGEHLDSNGMCQNDEPVPITMSIPSCSDGLVLDTNYQCVNPPISSPKC